MIGNTCYTTQFINFGRSTIDMALGISKNAERQPPYTANDDAEENWAFEILPAPFFIPTALNMFTSLCNLASQSANLQQGYAFNVSEPEGDRLKNGELVFMRAINFSYSEETCQLQVFCIALLYFTTVTYLPESFEKSLPLPKLWRLSNQRPIYEMGSKTLSSG